jgi:bacterial/archaeal transporter family-2 protein
MALVFLLLAFGAGATFPIQAGLNARLATWVGGPIRASLVSFSVGTVVMLVLAWRGDRHAWVAASCRRWNVA